MQRLKNERLKGRKDAELNVTLEDGEISPLTTWRLLEQACYFKARKDAGAQQVPDMADARKLGKVLDALETQGEEVEHVELEADQYNMIKPAMSELSLRVWPVHAPDIMDKVDELERETGQDGEEAR